MKRFLFTTFFVLLFLKQNAQEKILYKNNGMEVSAKFEAIYYGLLEYPTADSNQVILTKFYNDDKPLSRTFYIDYKNRIKHNAQMLFRPSGQLAKTISYNFDTLHGPTKYFNSAGKLILKDLYVKGNLYGYEPQEYPTDSIIKISRLVENTPIFPGCDTIYDDGERFYCTMSRIDKCIKENLKYPKEALANKTAANLQMRFSIDKNGRVNDPLILERSIESNMFDENSYQVMDSLPTFIAGTQYGEAAKFYYTIPIHFKDNSVWNELEKNTYYHVGNLSSLAQRDFRKRGNESQNVDRMPIWKGCELRGFVDSEDECTEWRLAKYIRKNVVYPAAFIKRDLEESITARFTVNELGELENIKLVFDSEHEEFNESAMNVLESIPKFIPAKRNDAPVPYDFSVMVSFRYR